MYFSYENELLIYNSDFWMIFYNSDYSFSNSDSM